MCVMYPLHLHKFPTYSPGKKNAPGKHSLKTQLCQ